MANSRQLVVEILGDSRSAQRALSSIEGGASRMGRVMGAVGRAVKVGALALASGIAIAGGAAIKNAIEAEKVAAQTKAALKSTGGAAGVTAKEIGALATKIMTYSGVSDEAIQSGENLLLTFTNIRNEAGKGNDVFNQATATMTDMSVALGQDMKSSAIQLGKALNDPIKGITALTRVGVSFTEQQKAQITALVESGKTMEAQKLILGELNKEFGGSAKAMGGTLEGQFNIMKEQLGNFLEDIGTKLIPILKDMLPTIGAAIKGLIDLLAPVIQWTVEGIAMIGEVIGAFVSDLKGPKLQGVTEAAQGIVSAFKDAVAWIVENVVPRVRDVIIKIVRFLMSLRDQAKEIWAAIRDLVQAAVERIKAIWARFGDEIKSTIETAWNFIKTTIRAALEIIKGIIQVVTGIIKGDWSQVWEGIKSIFKGVWEAIKGVIRAAMGVLKNAISAGLDVIKSLWNGIWNGIKSAFKSVWDFIVGVARRAAETVRSIIDSLLGPIDEIIGKLSSIMSDNLQEKIQDVQQQLNSGQKSVLTPAVAVPSQTVVLQMGDVYTQDSDQFSESVIEAVTRGIRRR